MKALVRVQQGWHVTCYKFDDEISAIQFATISKEHVINLDDSDKPKTFVSVVLDVDENDIEE